MKVPVPQNLLDEATRRGIVEGATIACSDNQSHGIVSPIDEWHSYDSGTLVVGTDDAGDWLCAKWQKNAWATVITPAPSQGLEEGMATECSPAMRAAIIELAKELGVRVSDFDPITYPHLAWTENRVWEYAHGNPAGSLPWTAHCWIPNHEFLARLEATAKKPKPITVISEGATHTVEFRKGAVKVGCTTIPNETVRAIAAKLQD